MYHKVTLFGYVRKEPEMRYLADGTAVTTIGVVTSKFMPKKGDGGGPQGWRETKNGAGYEATIWWRVTFWGGQAEYVNRSVHKGLVVFIEGELTGTTEDGNTNPRIWFDKDGNARTSFEVTGREIKHGFSDVADRGSPVVGDSDEDELPF